MSKKLKLKNKIYSLDQEVSRLEGIIKDINSDVDYLLECINDPLKCRSRVMAIQTSREFEKMVEDDMEKHILLGASSGACKPPISGKSIEMTPSGWKHYSVPLPDKYTKVVEFSSDIKGDTVKTKYTFPKEEKTLESIDKVNSFITTDDMRYINENQGFSTPKGTVFTKHKFGYIEGYKSNLLFIHKETMLQHWIENKVTVQYD